MNASDIQSLQALKEKGTLTQGEAMELHRLLTIQDIEVMKASRVVIETVPAAEPEPIAEEKPKRGRKKKG